jgi:hypothetical protein
MSWSGILKEMQRSEAIPAGIDFSSDWDKTSSTRRPSVRSWAVRKVSVFISSLGSKLGNSTSSVSEVFKLGRRIAGEKA